MEDDDIGVEIGAASEGGGGVTNVFGQSDIDAESREGFTSWRIEGMVGACVDFAGTASAQEDAVEADGDFRNRQCGDFDGIGQISPCVVSQGPHWALCARYDDGFVESL